MEVDYQEIGRRIARRRKQLGLTQAQVSELTETSKPYISNIERSISIPSTEVIMRIAIALDTTPDEFLVGSMKDSDEEWRSASELLRTMNEKQLKLAKSFLNWLREQEI